MSDEMMTRQQLTDELVGLLVETIAVVEARAARDAAKFEGSGFDQDSADGVATFWSAYQAGLHDLLYQIDPEGREPMRRFADLVVVDTAGWGNLAAVDAYAQAGRVDRAQAIKWLVNAALAHPTRESCYTGETCCNTVHSTFNE